jgi:hypothetical protein
MVGHRLLPALASPLFLETMACAMCLAAVTALEVPYLGTLQSTAPFQPTATWSGGSMTLHGAVPAPVLLAGDMLLGALSSPLAGGASPAAVPMTVSLRP